MEKNVFDQAMRNLIPIRNPFTKKIISYGTRVEGRSLAAHTLQDLANRVKQLEFRQ